MAFVNFSLIFGGLLLAIPIVLHLVMRQQPKQLVFPALRFLKARREANRRQLQLRHWLLLLLRCLAITLLAAALARPSVPSLAMGNWIIIGVLATVLTLIGLLAVLALVQRRGRLVAGGTAAAALLLAVALTVMLSVTLRSTEPSLLGNREAPVGAVLVFDSSPRMQYLWQNKTRLEQAREIALWLIRQLPADSEMAVVDARPGSAVFAVDLAAAQRSVERMDITFVPAPLVQVLDAAVQLAATSTRSRKEVYVLTDLTRGAWHAESYALLQRRLAEAKDVALHVVDVGCEQPQNFLLGDLQLSAQVLPKSGELQIRTQVDGVGTGGTRTVELYLEPPDPERPFLQDGKAVAPVARLRRQEIVTVPENGSQTIDFHVANLELGVQQGCVKLTGQDGLPCDNIRYFTIEVQDATPVLVLAPAGTTTKYLTEAIAPYEFRQTGRARYECTVNEQAELSNVDLGDYAAVCLLDPAPLTPPEWDKLSAYVRGGGGLAIFLGHHAATSSFHVPAAATLVGGKLARQWRSEGDVFLSPRNFNHPVTSAFRAMASAVPWTRFPVYRHWVLEDFSPETRLVMPFSNNKPAILETPLGQGRTLLMTTPISDSLRPRSRPAWNELPSGENAWPYVVLVNEMVRYLADTAGLKLNYLVGETAVLANRRDKDPERYQLFTPLDQPQDVTAATGKVVVKFTEYPGAYRLKGHRGGPVMRGFCANLPRAASDLRRLAKAELDEVLGAGRYHFARNIDEIQFGVGEARMGREFYPLLLALLAIILALEQLLANRFYRPSD
jgi:Aerotolerance regulator N-terminal